MKILFVFPREKRYDSQTVRLKPTGGTEKAVIYLGEALQGAGHEVEWLTGMDQLEDMPRAWDGAVIAQEARYFDMIKAPKRIWWSHHISNQPAMIRNAPWGRCFADHVVTLSQYHHYDLKENLRIDSVVIGHGLHYQDLDLQTAKVPGRMIYASTPFRGLDRVPEVFARIQAERPQATLSVCSSMQTYGLGEESDREYQDLFRELSTTPGITVHGALAQQALFREYAQAEYFLYPCHWAESYCIALDEAIGHGCTPAVTDLGALPERVEPVLDWGNVDEILGPKNPKTPRTWADVAKDWGELLE